MAGTTVGQKLTGLAMLCLLASFCGIRHRCGNQGTGSSGQSKTREEPYYQTCRLGRSFSILRKIAADEKKFPTVPSGVEISCEEAATMFRAGDKVFDQEKERVFDSRFRYKRVVWRARVVSVETHSWTAAAVQDFGTQHGVVLQFQCDPTKFTSERISSDGVVFYDGDKLDMSRLDQFRKGSMVEFEGILTDYSTRINVGGDGNCFYLKGVRRG